MATNIPPHNMGEVIDGMCALIDNPQASLEDIQQYIKGPDFPTGGIIMGRSGIRAAYAPVVGVFLCGLGLKLKKKRMAVSKLSCRNCPTR